MFEKCDCGNDNWIVNPSEIFGSYIVALVCVKCNKILNYKARLPILEDEETEEKGEVKE